MLYAYEINGEGQRLNPEITQRAVRRMVTRRMEPVMVLASLEQIQTWGAGQPPYLCGVDLKPDPIPTDEVRFVDWRRNTLVRIYNLATN